MKTRWLYGVFTAIALCMCTATYAETYSSDGIMEPAPTQIMATYTVEPPLVPAVKPNSDGIGAGSIGLSSSIAYSELNVDNLIPRTVACSTSIVPADKPPKIPISI